MEHRLRRKIVPFPTKKVPVYAANFLKFLPIKIEIQTSQRGRKCIVILLKDGHSFQIVEKQNDFTFSFSTDKSNNDMASPTLAL